ncbi:40S ribosomal protein [Blastomyces percursus]|uniref:40S ribosomal protein S3 n=1 Tax=Blastomyces percursus TaxID=1658174 RepID=A0A1J9RG00_9EURO|nr:40S ribosomal protein [Blastomyces percursus]
MSQSGIRANPKPYLEISPTITQRQAKSNLARKTKRREALPAVTVAQQISLPTTPLIPGGPCFLFVYLKAKKQQITIMAAAQGAISKRRKFVADGVFYAELNEFFQRELAEEGYSGVEVRVTPTVTDIIIRATHTQEVLGEQGRRIRELTSLIQKRFKFPENSVSLYAAKVQNRGLSAVAQCESLRYKLLNGLAVRRACYGVLRFIMESGAKGCEVVVSGKLRAARAKSMKFTDGFMIHSGQPVRDFIDSATRHVLLRQGVLGIKVKIMRGSDPEGKSGPQKSLPDSVTIIEPKEEQPVLQPLSQDYGAKALAAQQLAEQQRLAEQQEAEAVGQVAGGEGVVEGVQE